MAIAERELGRSGEGRGGCKGLDIGPMTVGDIEAVFEIEKKAYSNPWPLECFRDELEGNKFGRYWVGRQNGQVVGYSGMWHILDEAHITNLAVSPDFRRMKIGERLLLNMIDWSVERSVKSIFLEARKSNAPALSLYARYSFCSIGVRKQYYSDNGEDAIVLRVEDASSPVFLASLRKNRLNLLAKGCESRIVMEEVPPGTKEAPATL